MPHDKSLFSRTDWFSFETNRQEQLRNEITTSYGDNRLLNTTVDILVKYFVEKYSLDAPVLKRDQIVVDQLEARVDVSHRFDYLHRGDGPHLVPGTTIEITIPFSGDPQAFQIRPTLQDSNPPEGTVHGNAVVLEVTGIDLTAEEAKRRIEEEIKRLEFYCGNLGRNASSFNTSLATCAENAIESRRAVLLANQNLVSSLGFALKKNPNTPRTFTAPDVRRKLSPTPPPASSAPYRPEPTLSTEDYEHILDVIQKMAHVMERSPSAFIKMDEESLRTQLLVQLNGHYEGNATGETFNSQGKTDILIRVNDKNIFIGECKFWGGPKVLTETIDQLLGYVSWRDTKVAVIIFNRNKDLTKVLEAAQATTSSHPNFKRFIGKQSETSFRYMFTHRNDANREMTLTVMVFDVPK